MPVVYAVPGQHDLPNHNYDEIKRSGYWTLKEAGKLNNLPPGKMVAHQSGVSFVGFPWGMDPVPYQGPKDKSGPIKIAVIHKYCWIDGCRYNDAPAASHASKWSKMLKGYDVAIVGDNHIGFITSTKSGCTLINNGTMLRRHSDERHYEPVVWVLYSDKSVHRVRLDTSQDKYMDYGKVREAFNKDENITRFIELLRTQKASGVSFEEHMTRALDGMSPAAADLIRKAMDG